MASAPKKPRTDEQFRAEEKPEVDGDPPADVPPVRKPRLPPKGRAWLQLFVAKECSQLLQADESLLSSARTLLVSRSYLNAFFNAHFFGPAQIWIYGENSVHLYKSPLPIFEFATTFKGIAGLLRCARELATIKIVSFILPTRSNAQLMSNWREVASKLHALPALSSIDLDVWGGKCPFVDVLLDSLPDCVTRLEADSFRIATLFRKRTALLEEVRLSDDSGEDAYLADVFRLKSRRIELSVKSSDESAPYGLPACGSFDQNKHLQELHLAGEVFAQDAVPTALRQMRAINAHFEVVWQKGLTAVLHEPRDWAEMDERVKESADELRKAGFEAELRIGLKDLNDWQHVSQDELIDHFQWEREDVMDWFAWGLLVLECSFVHHGVRIVMGLPH